jgi:phenylacetate-coenzyme A ligase PaaK-like adenylate-forming protein
MAAMSDIEIPESFRGRPYAERHFRQIVQWASAHSPFYRHFHAGGGVLPLLTREILQAHNEELLNGLPVTGKTSGATSVPVRVHWGAPRSRLDHKDNLSYAGWYGGVLPHAKIVALSAHEKKDNSFEVASPVSQQLDFLRARIRIHGAKSLISYPTNLVQLAQHLRQDGQTIPELERLVCMSELFEASQEACIAEAFPNARIAATYSCTETGMIAGRCPHNPDNYHIMAHKLGVEFLNADGRPCAEGEVGQIVITDYFNRAMPFIRYAIGDLAAPVRCECGKIELPALTRLLGKQRGLLRHPDGHYVFSTELSPHIRDSIEVRQYQVIQHAPTRFLLRVIARDGADAAAFEVRMRELFTLHFGVTTELVFDWCADIPRLPGGKYMEFVGLKDPA